MSAIAGISAEDRWQGIADRAPGRTDERFDSVLKRLRAPAESTPEAARTAAEEFVATSLVQPILAQLREQNEAAAPFAPGPAEKMFGPLWDAEIALRIAKAQRFGLVDAVARNLRTYGGATGAAEAATHAAG